MARVYVLSTALPYDPNIPRSSDELRRFLDTVPQDRFKIHTLTDDPKQADLILFIYSARPDVLDIRTHPLYRAYQEKCFLLHHGDRQFPFLPGIYTCAERGLHSERRSRTGSYWIVMENPRIAYSPDYGESPYLFSFVGRATTAKVRQALLQLKHPRGLILDSSSPEMDLAEGSAGGTDDRYVSILARSLFVLCPRGLGSSSYRLFETLKAGRVPVILSDRWIPPRGPEWERFAVFVKEAHAARIPRLLEEREKQAVDMGRAARQAWEEWFSEKVLFHRSVEACLELLSRRILPEAWSARLVHLRRCRPDIVVRYVLRNLLRNGRGVSSS
jgi:Exostosin family